MFKTSVLLVPLACSAIGGSIRAQCPDLAPLDDGTGQSIGLLISEINPGDYIEIYNFTASDIELAGSPFQLCSPFFYSSLSALTGASSIVPARGYVTLGWPASFTDVDSGGEIILYSNSAFSSVTSIMDFVCWGTNPHSTRIAFARAAGKWSGSCAAPLSNGALHRLSGTDGTTLSSYDTSSPPSPLDCPTAGAAPSIGSPSPCDQTQMVSVGVPLTFAVVASDSDAGDLVTLTVAGLPAGASMTPPLPAQGNPVSSTFDWTPTNAQVGTFCITYTASDGDPSTPDATCEVTVVAAECFLIIADRRGNSSFTQGGFTWSTQLGGIQSSYPVLLNSLPTFPIPTGPFGSAGGPKRKLWRFSFESLTAQIVMYNPEVFPTNPVQWSNSLQLVFGPNGFRRAQPYGSSNGMEMWVETIQGAQGKQLYRFPFSIEGF